MFTATATATPPIRSATSAETDLSLLHRYAHDGDVTAFAEIVRRYGDMVFAASLRILHDEAAAQDVSQETFFRLLRQPKLVSHSLGGWLHRSATHLAIDYRRSERSRQQRERSYHAQQPRLVAEPTWEEISPHIDAGLNEVPEPGRSLLIRHFLQAVPQADLAAELSLSPATMSRRIKAAVDQLQALLKRRGVYIGIAALTALCTERTTQAMPARMLSELGKMHLVGPVGLHPLPLPNPRVRMHHRPWTPRGTPAATAIPAEERRPAYDNEEARFALTAGFCTIAFLFLGSMLFVSAKSTFTAAAPTAPAPGHPLIHEVHDEPAPPVRFASANSR